MKYVNEKNAELTTGRSPCGERGLKYLLLATGTRISFVAPRAGSVG